MREIRFCMSYLYFEYFLIYTLKHISLENKYLYFVILIKFYNIKKILQILFK